ncbi:MAG: response regulator [Rhodocyclaceae bacterium]|nr:response regulator [Rhodocyclaceae bacterium]
MSTLSILLIEDCAEDVALMVDALARVVPREQIGVCMDGAAAVDFFQCRGDYASREEADLPAFVLLDLGLPRVGGLDVLRAIRAQPSSRLLPVTVLSASDREADARAAAQLGANSFVRKPGNRRQLIDTLGQLARYWLELNVPPPCCARP